VGRLIDESGDAAKGSEIEARKSFSPSFSVIRMGSCSTLVLGRLGSVAFKLSLKNAKIEENSHNPAAQRKHMVDVYYMYRLARPRAHLNSSQGTSEAWHPRVDYELLL